MGIQLPLHAKRHTNPHFSAQCSGPHPPGPHFTHNRYCRLGSARRAARVAILPDNCHPSSSVWFGTWRWCTKDLLHQQDDGGTQNMTVPCEGKYYLQMSKWRGRVVKRFVGLAIKTSRVHLPSCTFRYQPSGSSVTHVRLSRSCWIWCQLKTGSAVQLGM